LEKAFGKYLTSLNLLMNKPSYLFIQAVYEWIRGKVGTSRLIVWGHSLGTAVSSHLVSDLCLEGNRPDGLILG
jgi:stringent starvation protein B